MSVVDSVRRGWRLLDRRARRDIRYVAVINLAATIGMFFYPEEDIAYRFSSEEVYVASLDYLNGVVFPLWGFMFFAGMVCLIVAISLLVHAYRIVRGAYMEERFPGRELPDRAAWPFLPSLDSISVSSTLRISFRARLSSRLTWRPARFSMFQAISRHLSLPRFSFPGCFAGSCCRLLNDHFLKAMRLHASVQFC